MPMMKKLELKLEDMLQKMETKQQSLVRAQLEI